jgi:hypothetical protein
MITVTFTPQESCPWLPFNAGGSGPSASGAPPEFCPLAFQNISVTINIPSDTNPDHETAFAVPIAGIGLSAIQPSVPELDFGAPGQILPLSLTNASSTGAVRILDPTPACTSASVNTLPSPRTLGSVAGLQVVSGSVVPDTNTIPTTVLYSCDIDFGTNQANFKITSDNCSGVDLAPGATCSLMVQYLPQANTGSAIPLDYFLELNTLQCFGGQSTDCEIDSGRFPVEIRSTPPGPLTLSPSAGVDFGTVPVGQLSNPSTITLTNSDPSQTLTFIGKIQVSGSYTEFDNCQATLAPGATCTLTVNFKPSVVGFAPGLLVINYSPEPANTPQKVYLRGTGQ